MEHAKALPNETELILHHYAYSCYSQGHWKKAIATFRQLTMCCPQKGGYWYGLGSSLMLAGRDADASRAFEIASAASPEDPRPLAFWAECAARQGLQETASRCIAKAEIKAKTEKFSPFLPRVQVIKERIVEAAHGR
jgi:Flp pilus assembly protein TadD